MGWEGRISDTRIFSGSDCTLRETQGTSVSTGGIDVGRRGMLGGCFVDWEKISIFAA